MGDNESRGVSLSPKSMVDSVADWPLHRVVDHLRKKEKDEKDSGIGSDRPVFVTCRSSIKLLPMVVGELAERFGVSHNQMCRWLSYHGVAIAEGDTIISKMATLYAGVRKAALAVDDADTLDCMDGLVAYSPRITDDRASKYPMYESWVMSKFQELSAVCGIHKYYIVQIFLLRSALSGDTSCFEGALPRLEAEVKRWSMWMGIRLSTLEQLAEKLGIYGH